MSETKKLCVKCGSDYSLYEFRLSERWNKFICYQCMKGLRKLVKTWLKETAK